MFLRLSDFGLVSHFGLSPRCRSGSDFGFPLPPNPPTLPDAIAVSPLNSINKISIDQAASPDQLASIRELFLEYASSLEISLCFQNFEQELASLPGKYAPPAGRILLAQATDQSVGCVALRPIDAGVCEMKRLYVRPNFRGRGLGRSLALAIIAAAREVGYKSMRLDTLASMAPAITLYRRLGFRPIPAYYANPSDNAVFLELILLESIGASVCQAGESVP
jgi:ribosomal protein S18 acetylase RimI-like enzyme